MRQILLKLLIFPLFPALVLVFPAWVLWASGEWTPIESVLQRQLENTHPMLVEYAYHDPSGYMKLRSVQEKKPEVVALGTSRVMEFRSDFFKRSFYNAGGAVWRFDDFQKFLGLLRPGEEPKLLIIGLNQKFFNPNYELWPRDSFKEPGLGVDRLLLFEAWDKIYRDFFQGKFSISDITKHRTDGIERIGLNPFMRDQGYRNDGSHQWFLWRDDGDLNKIAENLDAYIRGMAVSDKTIAQLDAFLSECRRRGIYVAAFLPPYSPPVYRALRERKKQYVYVFQLAKRIKPIFERHGFSFQDFTDPASLDVESTGYIDGEHLSEEAYRRLWSIWTEREPLLKSY